MFLSKAHQTAISRIAGAAIAWLGADAFPFERRWVLKAGPALEEFQTNHPKFHAQLYREIRICEEETANGEYSVRSDHEGAETPAAEDNN
jgi:hypothetical protein